MIAALVLRPGNIVGWILVGLIAGALAGRIARGKGYGCLGDIILGLIGSVVGGFVISLFVRGNTMTGFFGTTAVALVGALILIVGVRLLGSSLF